MNTTPEAIDPELAMANFSSLPPEERHKLVTQLIGRRHRHRLLNVELPRRKKEELIKYRQWPSCLNKKELIMIGDLHEEEADHQSLNPFYLSSDSKDKDMRQHKPLSDDSSPDDKDRCLTFAERIRPRSVGELMPHPSHFKKEYFVDEPFNEPDPYVRVQSYLLRDHKENFIGVDVKDYRRLMKHNLGRRWRR